MLLIWVTLPFSLGGRGERLDRDWAEIGQRISGSLQLILLWESRRLLSCINGCMDCVESVKDVC